MEAKSVCCLQAFQNGKPDICHLAHDTWVMAATYLKDASYAMPVKEDFENFLKVIWKGDVFHFTCGLELLTYQVDYLPVGSSKRRLTENVYFLLGYITPMKVVY